MNKGKKTPKLTVRRLIKYLEQFPPSVRVVVDGYEGGYADIGVENKTIDLLIDHNIPSYYGAHEKYDPKAITPDDLGYEKEKAVYLGRREGVFQE